MPISANKLIYDVRRKANAVSSGRANSYRIVDLVSAINDAFESIVEQLVSVKDQNETIRNHLRPLLVSGVPLSCSSTGDPDICKMTYPDDFYEVITMRVTTSKDCCSGEKKSFDVQKPQGDDIGEARRNPYRRADYYFEQLPCYETKDGLLFYHDGEMDIESVSLTYYKKVTRIEAPEMVECEDDIYKDWDGNIINTNVDFELGNTYINSDVTDLAAIALAGSSEDYVKAIQALQRKIQINQLYK